jgi:hypothetical protein
VGRDEGTGEPRIRVAADEAKNALLIEALRRTAEAEPIPPWSPADCGMLPVKLTPPLPDPNADGVCCIRPGATLAS